ncbi:hypothetical protein DSM112329_03545 [Paraconexibacter sp. AEG42_29]|uniref:Uncharacterized protein n=1 Tax=Paraconexibacter sp. AEG42_29 TaxID=2997339 RepID=A0AAU7AY47_9ACTN
MPLPTPDRRPSRARRGDRGQAALDYLGVVAVVAVILGVIGTFTVGPSIVNGVGETFQRALCKVTGDSCAQLERAVCTVRTRATDVSVTGRAVIFKVGRGLNLLRSERSDGTVELTLLDKFSGGVEFRATPAGGIRFGGRDLGVSGMAQAAAIAELGGGRMWRVPDKAAADKLQDKLEEVMVGKGVSALAGPLGGMVSGALQKKLGVGSGIDLPEPTAHLGSLKADVGLKLDPGIRAELDLGAALTVGGSKNTAGGGTVYVASSPKLSAAVLGGLGNLGMDGEVRLALTIGVDGKPSTLALSATGNLKGGLIGKGLKGDGSLPVPKVTTGVAGRSATVTATFDLTTPESRAAVSRLLKASKPSGIKDLPGAAWDIGRMIGGNTRLDMTTYATDEKIYGGGLDLPQGGISADYKRTKSDLLDAWTRPAGGAWEQREDCLRA